MQLMEIGQADDKPMTTVKSSSTRKYVARNPQLKRVTRDEIKRGVEFMVANLHKPIKVSDLMKVSGMSARGFHDAFKNEVGRSPGQTLKWLRIQRAKELLRFDYRIRTVVAQCGFRTISAFDVAFKQEQGVSPSQYQKRILLHNGARPGVASGHPLSAAKPTMFHGRSAAVLSRRSYEFA